MLELRHLCDLTIAAASGLVHDCGHLFVVADDSAVIAVHSVEGTPVELVALDRDSSPKPKAEKPDVESLAVEPGGALVAIGSGSTPKRERGWRFSPVERSVEELSLSPLYAALRRDVDDLNIEGLAFGARRAWLAQRGNGSQGRNALIELAWPESGSFAPEAVAGIRDYDLGDVDGVPLTFSDLEPLDDGRLLFCAVAEGGGSTHDDGPCVGSAVGLLDPQSGEVERLVRLAGGPKVEGITLGPGASDLLLVADDDDPSTPAPLLAAPSAGLVPRRR